MKTFKFQKKILDEAYSHAIEEAPSECCGWILELPNGKQQYVKIANLQDKYHKMDPILYPRTSKDAFMMNTLELTRAINKSAQNQDTMFCLVHSHVDCGAYFSDEDKKQMSNPELTDQIYPVSCYLVVATKNKKPDGCALFVYDKKETSFVESKVNLVS